MSCTCSNDIKDSFPNPQPTELHATLPQTQTSLHTHTQAKDIEMSILLCNRRPKVVGTVKNSPPPVAIASHSRIQCLMRKKRLNKCNRYNAIHFRVYFSLFLFFESFSVLNIQFKARNYKLRCHFIAIVSILSALSFCVVIRTVG